jgi:hypothetical protein
MRSKYNAKRTVVDGITFASKKEAKRYGELKLLERGGRILGLELQPAFDLRAKGGGKVGVYRADFAYHEKVVGGTRWVVEDVKGFKTPVYRLKKKHLEAQYGIQITEV